ncbi:MAG: 4Fe-4S binding protein [Syntrophales bacterium]|nr:4Fe-4S binding protein [Syntrophales bacterium]
MRKKIRIDETLCNGCGACIPACAEGAIKIVDGKARLIREDLCDGLGGCIGTCPYGAISFVEMPQPETNIVSHLHHVHTHTCPSQAIDIENHGRGKNHLTNWPIQISLLPLQAPLFKDAHLTISADCVPFAYSDFSSRFIQGRKICMGCPKLDDIYFYEGKIGQIISLNALKEIEVAYMEVPCCVSLARAVLEARKQSGKAIPLRLTRIGLNGEIKESKII